MEKYKFCTILLMSLLLLESKSMASTLNCQKPEIASTAAACTEKIMLDNPPICIKSSESDFITKESNGKTVLPEVIMKEKMKDLTNEETFIRLIFAENLASNCPSEKNALGIAKVLKSRLQKSKNKAELGGGVVFAPQQFRSTTGSCDVAKRKEFLCPDLKNDIQKKAWSQAVKAYFETKNSTATQSVSHYFFLKAFDESKDQCAKYKGVRPSWSQESKALENMGEKGCVEFYSL